MSLISLIFGLAIFLFAMHSLEAGIRLFSGKDLKRWIVSRTNNAISSAGSGVLVTAILQSSSMVSLLALAFVSAGIMPLYNGIGIILGANLGTTLTGWMATIIGFKMDLQALVVPLLGVGASFNIGYFKDQRVIGIGKALFAFGLLIFGLDIMKESVTGLSEVIDLSALQNLPAWLFLVVGLALAAIMQSSSAVMIITLSMLNSGMLQLSEAAAVVIGADLGTTSTTVLGSLGGSIIKKQLAAAHVLFNLVTNTIAFLLLLPALPWLLKVLNIRDTMFGLVAFHSVFNLVGLLVFLPTLKTYTTFIQKLLPVKTDSRIRYFEIPVTVPDVAIKSLERALNHLSFDVLKLNFKVLGLDINNIERYHSIPEIDSFELSEGSFEEQYEQSKEFEGNLIRYAGELNQATLNLEQEHQVRAILESARAIVYASKTLKDVRHDITYLIGETSQLGKSLETSHREFLLTFYELLIPLLFIDHDEKYLTEQIATLSELNGKHHEEVNLLITQQHNQIGGTSTQLSTWFNLNHELHHYIRYMMMAIRMKPST